MAQDRLDKTKDREANKSNDFSSSASGSSSFRSGSVGTETRTAERGQARESGPETGLPGQERRPRYGYYYASAVQRSTTRRRPVEERSGRSGQGGYGERPYGRGGSGLQGGYGVQGGQGGYSGQGFEEQTVGSEQRDRVGGERRDFSREGGEVSVEHNRSQRSQFDRGALGGGLPQGARGYEDYGTQSGVFGLRGSGGEYGRGQGSYDRNLESASGGELGRGYGQTDYGSGYDFGGSGRGAAGSLEREGRWGFGERDSSTESRERDWRGEGRRTRWQREPFTAGEIMTREVKAVTKQSTLQNVAEIMKDENCGIVPIVDESHKLLGVVTDRDLVIRTLAEGKSPSEVKVEDIMTDDVEVVTPNEDLREVVELMGKKQVRRIPVVDRDDRLVGIIAMADIANRADYDEDLQDALESISSKRSFWNRLWS